MRVLVVDDNPVDRERVRRALRKLSATEGVEIEVAEAADGLQAIEALEAGPSPDLVVTDLSMPGFVTGYQVEQVASRRGVRVEVMSGLPPLAPHWAAKTRSKDRLDWLRDAVLLEGQRQGPRRTITGPLRRVLMAGASATGVLAVALLSGWM